MPASEYMWVFVCVPACACVCVVCIVCVYERKCALMHANVCECVCIYKRVGIFCISTYEQWPWVSVYIYACSKRICVQVSEHVCASAFFMRWYLKVGVYNYLYLSVCERISVCVYIRLLLYAVL